MGIFSPSTQCEWRDYLVLSRRTMQLPRGMRCGNRGLRTVRSHVMFEPVVSVEES